ncbi:Dityrosine transporter-like protein [Elsinoe fawcettii]|nr:Dityrosine transporter-like protein [Elsinoe fawcettii]
MSPNVVALFVFRALTAAQSTCFLILGSTCISDIYHPTERATAMGWFLRGTLFGPAFGPLIFGIVVTFRSWRFIFWIQTAMSGAALPLCLFLFQETLLQPRYTEIRGQKLSEKASKLWEWTNPLLMFKLLRERNLLCISIASSTLAFNMYALLTPIRYAGLLYLGPGAGYLIGSTVGGRWSDHVVKTWSSRRGFRLWEDRLRGALLLTGIVLPGSTLLYGWAVDRRLGGIALPVVCMVAQGPAQTCAFPCLNAYIMDVMQQKSGKAAASNYFIRYAFAAVATASIAPAIDALGVGWAVTISSAMVSLGSGLVLLTVRSGATWRSGRRLA